VLMVRYCMCHVVRATATELAQAVDTPFKPQLRRALFDALALGCEEGSQGMPSFGRGKVGLQLAHLQGGSFHGMPCALGCKVCSYNII